MDQGMLGWFGHIYEKGKVRLAIKLCNLDVRDERNREVQENAIEIDF